MKANPFVFSLGLTLVLIVVATLGIWKESNTNKPLKLDIQTIEVPDSGRYIPKNSYLTIHFNIDANQIPKYIASLSTQKKHNLALNKGNTFRNGLFALIGLDFEQDLSKWIKPRFSFSILNNVGVPNEKAWLLALEGINNDATQNFITSYWEKQSSSGLEIEKEEFEGEYIIHEINQNLENDNQSISMSLFDNNVLIVSSDKQVIEQAIQVSKDPSKNQLFDNELKETIANLDDGSALITASSEALQSFLQVPALVVEKIKPSGFAASVKAEGNKIFLDSYFKFNENFNFMGTNNNNDVIPFNYQELNLENIAIINKATKLIDIDKADIYSKWFGDLFRKSLLDFQTPISNIIVELEKDELIIGTNTKGWLLGVKGDDILSKIESILEDQGFNKSIVNLQDKTITVWSKLVVKREELLYELFPKIELILSKTPNINLWTNDISLLEERHRENQSGQQIDQLNQIVTKPEIETTQKLSLGEDSTQRILNSWKPWQIIKTGVSKAPNLKATHLELNVGEDNQNEESALNLRGVLSIN